MERAEITIASVAGLYGKIVVSAAVSRPFGEHVAAMCFSEEPRRNPILVTLTLEQSRQLRVALEAAEVALQEPQAEVQTYRTQARVWRIK